MEELPVQDRAGAVERECRAAPRPLEGENPHNYEGEVEPEQDDGYDREEERARERHGVQLLPGWVGRDRAAVSARPRRSRPQHAVLLRNGQIFRISKNRNITVTMATVMAV